MLASEMCLVSVITGHDLAVADKNNYPNAAEIGVSIFAILLAACYILMSLFLWIRSASILKSWEGHSASGDSSGRGNSKRRKKGNTTSNHDGEFDEIELI